MATTTGLLDLDVKLPVRHHLANWRNPSEYPSINETNPTVWAWEFLRRSHRYANDAKKTLALSDTMRKRKTSFEAFPASLPDNLGLDDSLAPWACYPSAIPNKKTLAQYIRDVGHRPTSGIRRDIFVQRRWGVAVAILPSSSNGAAVLEFIQATSHRPSRIDYVDVNSPRKVELTLMPDEVVVVFDLREPIDEQLDIARTSMRSFRQVDTHAGRLDRLKRTAKAQPMPYEMWAMLRLADAVREHQLVTGWKRGRLSNEYLCDGFKFKYFLDHIQYEAHRSSDIDSGHRQWLTNSLGKAQLQNWRADHLVRLVYCRGYLDLLPAA